MQLAMSNNRDENNFRAFALGIKYFTHLFHTDLDTNLLEQHFFLCFNKHKIHTESLLKSSYNFYT